MTSIETQRRESTEELQEEPKSQARLGRLSGPDRGPIMWLLDLFSSIPLGIVLLSVLFAYCAVGSVGVWIPGHYDALVAKDWIHEVGWFITWTQIHVRQAPMIELTEFAWFHWWPFNLLIALICVNIIVATLRRIPLNVINLGVWMIHTGILILAVGSVIYFGLKLEGDTPIIRRQVVVEIDGLADPVAFSAQPGTMKIVETQHGEYRLRVMSIDPHWEILTGDDAGKRAYAISVAVHSPEHQFVRVLLAGYPEYTEDTIWTGNPEQPMVRAVRELGRPIVDESIRLSLDYAPEKYFYLMDSRAVYLREKGQREWIKRPIHNLPRYNARVDAFTSVWEDGLMGTRPRPLEITLKQTDSRDPLGDTPIYVTSFLPYAVMETRYRRGGGELNPMVSVVLRDTLGQTSDYTLIAFNEERNLVEGGRLHFVWAESEDEFDRISRVDEAILRVRVADSDIELEYPARPATSDSDFIDIPDTDYAFRIDGLEGPMHLDREQPVSVAILTIRGPERTFRRWVFNDPGLGIMDFEEGGDAMMHDARLPTDDAIDMTYRPRRGPRPVTIIAGPGEDDLHLLVAVPGRSPTIHPLTQDSPVVIQESVALEMLDYSARAEPITRPFIVPHRQRDRDPQQFFSMIRIHAPLETGGESLWLNYHHYPFTTESNVLRRFPYRPAELHLPDGRVIEIVYSRQRSELPSPVALHDFEVVAHVGGFTGETSSIRDWISRIRFQTDTGWTDPEPVSMNKPANYRGFWFFQAQWDPPDPARDPDDVASAGLNYTVLGVGNRHGVWTQLFGCCVAVAGMIFAFYCKPILKRRRQQAVYARINQEAKP